MFKKLPLTLTVAIFFFIAAYAGAAEAKNPMVIMDTTFGKIKIELFQKEAPVTVANFLEYAGSSFYNGTIFHRIVPASPQSAIVVIQGGGLTPDMQPKATRKAIKNEATNGLKNDRGTLSMARSSDPDSATSQFFINVQNNDFLNSPSPDGFGYAVFGKVIEGMNVVDKIVATPIKSLNRVFQGVPVTPVVIKSVTLIK
jgi:peptidyl-prolyl cis-trans isomerase A (cyclophilin A)